MRVLHLIKPFVIRDTGALIKCFLTSNYLSVIGKQHNINTIVKSGIKSAFIKQIIINADTDLIQIHESGSAVFIGDQRRLDVTVKCQCCRDIFRLPA